MTSLCLAAQRGGAYRAAMLTCDGCAATSTGSAWHWIAVRHLRSGRTVVASYCPVCAEAKFAYFSRRRVRRLAAADEFDD